MKSPDEKKKRDKEEESKRLDNELAFKSWLKIKEEQRILELKKKNEKASTTTTNTKKSQSQENSVNFLGFKMLI